MNIVEQTGALRVDEIDSLPTGPGCYLFRGSLKDGGRERVLYVGKAKNLRARVRQYFRGKGDGRPFVHQIRQRVTEIEFIVVGKESDALVLENDLIKKYKPAFNIFLKDDKRFLSLRLDLSHEWPKIDIVRKIKKDGAVYMGPFSSSGRLRETLDLLQKTFPLRTCSDQKLYNRSRPCLEYEMKRCVAPCVDYVTQEEYGELVGSVVRFLKGESEALLEELQKKMERAAAEEEFEKAADFRDRIRSIEATLNLQAVQGVDQFRRGQDQDAIGMAFSSEAQLAVITVVFVRYGSVWDKRSFEFRNMTLDRETLLGQFIERYYSSGVYLPNEVLVPTPVRRDENFAAVKLVFPTSQEKKNFVELANQNAESELKIRLASAEKADAALEKIKQKLKLSVRPTTMDCIDVSHHGGKDVVASVVRFTEGRPDKDYYRRIKLSVEQVDDFAGVSEAIERRYRTSDDLPDLIVIDGGKGQLGAAEASLRERGHLGQVDLVSLAKARPSSESIDPQNPKNRERIFKPGQKNPILLIQNSPEENLLASLRDEAHRFAIRYHRNRKTKSLSISLLDEVPGMTERMKLKLMRSFPSVDEIRDAEDIDLLKVVNPRLLDGIRRVLGAKED